MRRVVIGGSYYYYYYGVAAGNLAHVRRGGRCAEQRGEAQRSERTQGISRKQQRVQRIDDPARPSLIRARSPPCSVR